ECDMVPFCLLAEELGRGSMSLAAAAMMQSLMGTHFVFTYGTEAQRERYLVPALRGEKIGTFALTEPGAGSDLGNMSTVARRDGEHWVLSGAKTWVTSAPLADFVTVGAKTSPERGLKHIALFLVDPREMPGVVIGKKIDKVSVRASDTGEITLEDEAARIFASYSLATEYPVQRYLRDSRFLLFGGGTSEILRLIIARGL